MLMDIYGFQKGGTEEPTDRAAVEMQTESGLMHKGGERKGRRG